MCLYTEIWSWLYVVNGQFRCSGSPATGKAALSLLILFPSTHHKKTCWSLPSDTCMVGCHVFNPCLRTSLASLIQTSVIRIFSYPNFSYPNGWNAFLSFILAVYVTWPSYLSFSPGWSSSSHFIPACNLVLRWCRYLILILTLVPLFTRLASSGCTPDLGWEGSWQPLLCHLPDKSLWRQVCYIHVPCQHA